MLKMMFKAPSTRSLLPPVLRVPSCPLPSRQGGKSTQHLQQHWRLPPTLLPAVSKGRNLFLERDMQQHTQFLLSSHLHPQLSALQPLSWHRVEDLPRGLAALRSESPAGVRDGRALLQKTEAFCGSVKPQKLNTCIR